LCDTQIINALELRMRNNKVAPMQHPQKARILVQVHAKTLAKAAVPNNANYDSASTTTTQLSAAPTNITTTRKTTTPPTQQTRGSLFRTNTNPSRC